MTQSGINTCCSKFVPSVIPKWDKPKIELLKWVFCSAILTATCLSFLYINPFITAQPEAGIDVDLNETLATAFGFERMIWIRLTFFSGFACSHFSFGFFANKYGNLYALKFAIKATIVCAITCPMAENFFLFCTSWFLVAYFSTSVYLLMIVPVLETVEEVTGSWKWRWVIGVLFELSWTFGRLLSNIVVTIGNSWTTVLLILITILCVAYFTLEKYVWKKEMTVRGNDTEDVKIDGQSRIVRLNLIILGLLFFTLGYNFYGNFHWATISNGKHSIFANNIIASVFSLISFICALLLCFTVKRKCLPLMALQIMTAVCYFVLASVDFKKLEHPYEMGFILVVHLSTFLIKASFDLAWVATPETFPKKNRTIYTGICSGFARIGAIIGIVMDEMKLLHFNVAVNAMTGIIILLSGLFIQFLPDMTQKNLPKTWEDISKVQYPSYSKKSDLESHSVPQT